ncbi:hypothetical protein BaRGS_00013817 [Batillaria attramentaria]|uniref:Vesicular, overexpressed in cancer, prosurvival protein 1 n=1 Tax=Batillaria attramentaria TaxID=370345 RepID=A0ABD0L6I9_9CAEN
MAAKTSVAAFTVLCLKLVEGYYCDSDKCSDDEYCCGYNLCCKSYKVWDLWYFWCGLLFFMFLLSMCGCLWRLRSRNPVFISGYNYTPLNQESAFVHTVSLLHNSWCNSFMLTH